MDLGFVRLGVYSTLFYSILVSRPATADDDDHDGLCFLLPREQIGQGRGLFLFFCYGL